MLGLMSHAAGVAGGLWLRPGGGQGQCHAAPSGKAAAATAVGKRR